MDDIIRIEATSELTSALALSIAVLETWNRNTGTRHNGELIELKLLHAALCTNRAAAKHRAARSSTDAS
jgi:hypothetical protein